MPMRITAAVGLPRTIGSWYRLVRLNRSTNQILEENVNRRDNDERGDGK